MLKIVFVVATMTAAVPAWADDFLNPFNDGIGPQPFPTYAPILAAPSLPGYEMPLAPPLPRYEMNDQGETPRPLRLNDQGETPPPRAPIMPSLYGHPPGYR